MKAEMAFMVFLCIGAAFASVPVAGNIKLSQDDSQMRIVTVDYSLSQTAIVTVDFQTNVLEDASGDWVSIGEANFRSVSGDVNKIVEKTEADGRRTITWNACAEWPNVRIGKPRFRAKLTVWPTNSPPDYMVIDLRPADSYPARYYVCEDALPYGPVTNKIYKDELLVLKRIRAKGVVWLRGAGEQMKNWFWDPFGSNWETYSRRYRQHPVMLTRDYYIGVYEITEGQYYRVRGGTSAPTLPRFPQRANYASNGSWVAGFRGGSGEGWPAFKASGEFDYDKSHAVNADSFFGRLRARAEVKGVYDMPTDAQWEYACRAGTDEPVPVRLEKTTSTDIYSNMCRYYSNQQTADCEGLTGYTMATVGSYEPNPRGLYDMLGNCYEFVLDHYGSGDNQLFSAYDPDKVLVDPYGSPDSKSNFCVRGGHASQTSGYCNAVFCGEQSSALGAVTWGTRVVMDIN